jgi:2'-5' RNA ligase
MARVRTFIAIELDAGVRQRLVALQGELGGSAEGVKWVEPENLHLTLLFLGDVRQTELVDVCRAVSDVARQHAAFPMRMAGLGGFPNLRRPRTLWVGVRDGADAVRGLHAGIEDALLELGCYRRETRPFTPHVTLGRLRSDGGTPHLPAKADEWSAGVTPVREVLVMSSDLTPAGPVYAVVGRGKLSAER